MVLLLLLLLLLLTLLRLKNGLEYMPGGVDSAFNKVEKEVLETRMVHKDPCCVIPK